MQGLYLFLFGMGLGFSLTIPPGPMNALIASESVVSSRRGMVTGAGAMSADLLLGAAVFLLHSVAGNGSWIRLIYAAGALVAGYMGVAMYAGRRKRAERRAGARTYARALVMGVTNPFQILWWLTAGLAFAYLGGLILFTGLFIAVAVWIVAFPAALHAGAGGRPRVGEAVAVASSVLMLLFAAYFAILAAGLI